MHRIDYRELDPNDCVSLRQSAKDWLRAFQDLEADLNCTTDPEFLKACLIIRITGLATLILSSLPTSELHYSQHKAEFLQIATFSEELLKIGGGMTQSVKAHLVHGIGPVNPVFFAATKCRLPTVRKRLLRALRRFKVAEGLWTSCAAYQVADQVAKIENSLADAEVDTVTTTQSNHISLKSVTFEDSTHISLSYSFEDNTGNNVAMNRVMAIQSCRHQNFFNQVRLTPFSLLPSSNNVTEPSVCWRVWCHSWKRRGS